MMKKKQTVSHSDKNRKIKNATPGFFDGIQFKSKAELNMYRYALREGIRLEYEPEKVILMKGDYPDNVQVWSTYSRRGQAAVFQPDIRKLRDLTYTPDFVYRHGNVLDIIEVKGFRNDVYPVKRKLFIDYLNKSDHQGLEVRFFEVTTIHSMKKCIKEIKNKMKT